MRWPLVVMLLANLIPAGIRAAPTLAIQFQQERARATRALQALRVTERDVQWSAQRTRPVAVRGLRVRVAGATDVERARRFLARHPDLFVDAGAANLRVIDVQGTTGARVVRFQQYHAGLPVEGAIVTVTLDPEGQVRAVASAAQPVALVSVKPQVSARTAVRKALRIAGGPAATDLPALQAARANLVILAEGTPRLVYRVRLPFGTDPSQRVHLVDAASGVYLGSRVGAIIDALPVKAVRR